MAQPPAPRVDFGREVQPILRDRCYGCHGPDQQMNGFRLDRRADALRGGSQTVIGPGNAEGTLLYRRLVDTNAGARMPPSGPLPAAEIAVIKAWIDQGVEWPDDLAGIPLVSSGGSRGRAARDADSRRGSWSDRRCFSGPALVQCAHAPREGRRR